MVLPELKLGTLALKSLSKPVAARLKKEAGLHPKFRNFIISLAQTNHQMTTTMQRYIYGRATDVVIRPLNEEKAVQSAVDLMGELFVFSAAVSALMFEVQRSSRSEAKKEELRRHEMEGMRRRDEEMAKEVEFLKRKLEEIEQIARGRGIAGVFNFGHAHTQEPAASITKDTNTVVSRLQQPASH